MASIRQSIRSSTASKRPTSAIADGQIALNTASGTPGMFFKDSAGNIIKTGPAHYGASAPNSSPAVGGSTGNSIGEAWLDSSLTPAGWKIWNGSAWVNATPLSSDTVQGLVELATNAETQAGADTARAVTSAGLQSKVSDSISTASSSGIASSSAVKTAYDLANAALPKSGGIITGNLEIGSTGSLTFEGATADGFETTLAVVDPTLDRTITFPNITGTVVTTGDTGTVTSTMILDGAIVDADINASAEIAVSKLADGAARQLLQTDAAGTGVEWASNIDIPGTLDVTSAATFDSTVAVTGALTKSGNNVVTVGDTGTVTSTMILDGTILNADVNASAAIAGTKISPDFGSQNTTTTGTSTAASFIPTSSSVPTNGVYLPAANSVAISTSGTGRITVDASGNVNIDSNTLYVDAVNNRVGVGTTSPAGKLHVNVASDTAAIFYSSGANVANIAALNDAGNSSRQLVLDGSPLAFNIASVEKARIDSSGRLGIGTSSPLFPLDVNGTIYTRGRGSTFGVLFDDWRIYNSTSPGALVFDNGTPRVTITSTGLVGIGTTSPSNALHINSGATGTSAKFESTGSGSYLNITNSSGAWDIGATGTNFILQNSGGEALRVDSSRRLLVGTSSARGNFFNSSVSPQIQLEGAGDNDRQACIISSSSTAAFGAVQILAHQKSGAIGGNTLVASGDALGMTSFQGSDGTQFVEGARIEAFVDGTPGADDMPGRLVFSTTADGAASPTPRMQIGSSGTARFFTSNYGLLLGNSQSAGTTYTAFEVYAGSTNTTTLGTLTLQIYNNGNVQNTNNSYGALSDVKLKENIVDAGSQWADIKAFRVRKYNLKEGQKHTQIGGIAQEVELVSPGLVTESPDRDEEGNDLGTVTKSINYSVLYMKAVKALQEAMERIETLETRLSALEGA